MNRSGRGDKDVDTAARWFGLLDDDAVVDPDDVAAHPLPEPSTRSHA